MLIWGTELLTTIWGSVCTMVSALLPAVIESSFLPKQLSTYNSFAGYGVDEDREKAAQFFMKAEEKKYLNGINSLGLCYYRGHGVAQDIEKAILLFKAAADRG